jgi:hypothetical protein
LVVALVGDRREEGMDQVAMRGVDIDHIEAGRHRPPRARAIGFHQCVDLGDRHGAGTVPAGDAARIGRTHGLPWRLAPRGLRLAERTEPLPGALPRRFRAGMVELRCRQRALLVQQIGDPAQGRDMLVGPDAEIAIGVAADRVHDQPLRHHRAGAADGVFREVLEMPVGRQTVRPRFVHLHRGDHDPVREGDGAQPERAEQQRLDHRDTHSCLVEKPPAARYSAATAARTPWSGWIRGRSSKRATIVW